jgi:hypothetical protein
MTGMADWFLWLMVWSVAPIAMPVHANAQLQEVVFYAWSAGQVALVVCALVAIIRRAAAARATTLLLVLGLGAITLAAAFSYSALQWDAQTVYDRVAHLWVQHRGWAAYAHGGNPWILGYPPGASLYAVWGILLHLPTSNFTQCVVMFIWMATFILRLVEPLGPRRSGYLFAALFFIVAAPGGWATPIWHYAVYYNNVVFAVIWMQLIYAGLVKHPDRASELLLSALVLVWLRPVVSIAALPLVSAAGIRWLSGERLKRTGLLLAAALAVQVTGVKMWQAKAAALEAQQASYQQAFQTAISEHKDPHTLELELRTPASPSPSLATVADPPRQVFVDATTWAKFVAMRTCAGEVYLLIVCAVVALALGWRRALAFAVPLGNLVALVVGTGFFALHYPMWRDNFEAWERMLIIVPILGAATATALDAELSRAARGTDAVEAR